MTIVGGDFRPLMITEVIKMASMTRKILRNIAKVQMEKEEIPNPCRKHITQKGETKESFFKRYWKEYASARINNPKKRRRA